jgi:hypothetical protein
VICVVLHYVAYVPEVWKNTLMKLVNVFRNEIPACNKGTKTQEAKYKKWRYYLDFLISIFKENLDEKRKKDTAIEKFMRKDFPLDKIIFTYENSFAKFKKKMKDLTYDYYEPVEPTMMELYLIPKFKKFTRKRLKDVPDYQ